MAKTISVIENILNANDCLAADNQALLDAHAIFSLNLMASPGAGKTSLIEHTVKKLSKVFKLAVIDGDIATSLDADRAAAAGAVAIQINTGGECHLDAVMLNQAILQLDLDTIDILLVENVGNLICPSSFKIGSHKNVLIASIPEGDDKPYKYPGMYRGVDVLVLNKMDLLPYVEFNIDYFHKGVRQLNPDVELFSLSCRTQDGLDGWINWIENTFQSWKLSTLRAI
jgi:hydrogenase nickel incorporation protein HypB